MSKAGASARNYWLRRRQIEAWKRWLRAQRFHACFREPSPEVWYVLLDSVSVDGFLRRRTTS